MADSLGKLERIVEGMVEERPKLLEPIFSEDDIKRAVYILQDEMKLIDSFGEPIKWKQKK